MVAKRKLIEVALPLEAINRESAREKSIRHGHPSTLHLWWARRPLAACRAVLFAQLVDDPSAHPEEFPTEADQETERKRLFSLIERLVVWENTTDQALLDKAHAEIVKSCDGNPPPILDPFARGGSIPLEAQRLGLEAHASDLNPVAVLINKALIEIPPKWAGQPPVFPGAAAERLDWPGATGLAEDVRRYGQWMRDEAEKRIGHLYPKATLPDGTQANVIAWIWARTVTCPNPACGLETPLVNSFTLSTRTGKRAHVLPVVEGKRCRYEIELGQVATQGPTVTRTGGVCVACSSGFPLSYVRAEGKSGRIGRNLICTVAAGTGRRIYLAPSIDDVELADIPEPVSVLEAVPLASNPRAITAPNYGITSHNLLYSTRQMGLLVELTQLVEGARERRIADGAEVGYATDLSVYLTLLLGRVANRSSSQSFWHPGRETVEQVFARNALPMIWVYAEANPFSQSSGNILGQLNYLVEALTTVPGRGSGVATMADAKHLNSHGMVFSLDPPYYDNVPYADLSDFFYVWHRRALGDLLPELYSTVVTPKASELIAEPARQGSKAAAARFFEEGLRVVFDRLVQQQRSGYPFTIFYAFKQSESGDEGTASTGWESMLQALVDSGASIVATWPVRTELAGGLRELGRNALASSVVLACRARPTESESVNRRQFLRALHSELPLALKRLQQGSIAPVDMAQAAIGPGMAVFSRYSRVVEADGSDMTVRTALALINQVLDEVLAEQEGDFDSDTRFAVKWFSQFGWNEAGAGEADILTRATNTSVDRLVRGGIFRAVAGRARLLEPRELSAGWDPVTDEVVSDWEVVVRLGHTLATEGSAKAARLMAAAGQRVDLDTVKELAYLLFALCEKRGWAESALLFNGLGTSWSDVAAAAPSQAQPELQLGFEM